MRDALSSSLSFYPFLLSSNPPLTRGKEEGEEGGDFVVAYTDLPRARAFIGLPHYFTTDSGLKGLNVVVRMGSGWYSPWYRDIKSVRYEDYPFSNERDGRSTRRRLRVSRVKRRYKKSIYRRTCRPYLRTDLSRSFSFTLRIYRRRGFRSVGLLECASLFLHERVDFPETKRWNLRYAATKKYQ